MFFPYFVVSFMMSSLTVAIIMLIRKVFQKQLSAKWKYNLWFFLFITLTIPFLPNQLFDFGDFFTWDIHQNNGLSLSNTSTQDHAFNDQNWMQNFALSVNRFDMTLLNETLAVTWIIGMLVMAILTIKAWLQLRRMKTSVRILENQEILLLFEQCKQSLNISKQLIIGESPLINSPLTFGLFKTYVLLPIHFDEWLSKEEMRYIFLHELNHYKYKDILTNYLVVFYQILYWFNPLVWVAFREMKLDREIACDSAVLHSLDKRCYAEYGNTIIHFLDKLSRPKYITLVNQLNGAKKQIKKRIESIAAFTVESRQLRLKSLTIFMLMGIFVASQIPIFSVMAYDDQRYEFDGKRTIYENLSKYFAEYEGSFVLYDLQADQYRIYNENNSTLRVSPNSTYKIYSALFALESNVITRENSTMKWNGKHYPYDSWNQNQNLSTAMKSSVNWYFQDLDKKVHLNKIQHYLSQINYGNNNLSGGLSQYWIESSLKISPIEQVQLLKAFYRNEFGFKNKNVQTLKEVIQLEEKNDARLSGKTGTGSVNGKNVNGWFIGYVETKQNTYFFATNIQNENNSYGSKAAEITKSILRDKAIY
ncbi:BlaR1 family beta-lactam sensor/signal transducer [Shimazuella alba]|uniref:BlaR1 family beta-lactam sensor/signal transducer n=1 Tax=Shimazuella alba TaxID=2690964 RepID=A0A6I4VRC0_9BACL|nr:BlaR1 family beta-lactam sensor/signal transducer [Shimazuella alba]MXQ54207.1 BlaR1 family beta-lactam sensor/signal transducer [Shimazuella alba]